MFLWETEYTNRHWADHKWQENSDSQPLQQLVQKVKRHLCSNRQKGKKKIGQWLSSSLIFPPASNSRPTRKTPIYSPINHIEYLASGWPDFSFFLLPKKITPHFSGVKIIQNYLSRGQDHSLEEETVTQLSSLKQKVEGFLNAGMSQCHNIGGC